MTSETATLARPGDLFNQKPGVKQLLKNSVEYAATTIENEGFIRDLGIRQEATAEEVLDYLERATNTTKPDKTRFDKIYEFISDKFTNNEDTIRDLT
jgi:hypothetical protein